MKFGNVLNFPLEEKSEKKNPDGFVAIHYVNVKNEGEEIKHKRKANVSQLWAFDSASCLCAWDGKWENGK